MPAKLEITRIKVSNRVTGEVYADGLLFNVSAPPAGTMCTWQMWIKNVGDEACYPCVHIRELYPVEGDWVNQCYPLGLEPGQEGVFGSEWGYPSEPFVEWRFSVEREVAGRRVVDDAYFIVATPTSLYSSRTEVPPPPTPTARLTVTPTRVEPGGPITIEWNGFIDGYDIYVVALSGPPEYAPYPHKFYRVGNTSSGRLDTYAPSAEGVYEWQAQQEVTGIKSNIVTVTVTPPAPMPLTITFTADKTTGPAPLEVTFSCSARGGALPYSWELNPGDGSSPYTGTRTSEGGWSVKHTYTKVGTFTATLTVTDALGASLSMEIAMSPGALIEVPWLPVVMPILAGTSALLVSRMVAIY